MPSTMKFCNATVTLRLAVRPSLPDKYDVFAARPDVVFEVHLNITRPPALDNRPLFRPEAFGVPFLPP